jgi:hypothetical protein
MFAFPLLSISIQRNINTEERGGKRDHITFDDKTTGFPNNPNKGFATSYLQIILLQIETHEKK